MKLRGTSRELAAEFLGTFVLMIFGLGVNAQVTLGDGGFGDFLSVNIGWGVAVTLGIYVSAAVSGAHLNPAVTLALAAWRGFPWSKVGPYILVQLAAAMVASLLIFVTYRDAIKSYDRNVARAERNSRGADIPKKFVDERGDSIVVGGNTGDQSVEPSLTTAGIFGTYPRDLSQFPKSDFQTLAEPEYLSNTASLIDQIVGTSLLVLCIFALTDQRNTAPGANVGPILVGSVVLLIGMTFGFNCGYAINPARDFGPRLFTFLAGWGDQVFTARPGYWWVSIVGPLIGGVLGGWIYDMFVARHHPSDN